MHATGCKEERGLKAVLSFVPGALNPSRRWGVQVREDWRRVTGGGPPAVGPGAPLVGLLELELPETGSEGREPFEELVGLLAGEETAAALGAAGDPGFAALSVLVQWLYLHDFITHGEETGELLDVLG